MGKVWGLVLVLSVDDLGTIFLAHCKRSHRGPILSTIWKNPHQRQYGNFIFTLWEKPYEGWFWEKIIENIISALHFHEPWKSKYTRHINRAVHIQQNGRKMIASGTQTKVSII